MSEAKHTPEPWLLEFLPEGTDRHTASELEIWSDSNEPSRFITDLASGRRGQAFEKTVANARRIVACVNYCAGSATSDLERLAELKLNGPHIIDRLSALERVAEAARRVHKLTQSREGRSELAAETETGTSAHCMCQPEECDIESLRAVLAALDEVTK